MFDDRLRVIFEYSPVAYCLVDFNGIFIDVNEAAARLVGYSREELRGKKLLELNIITPNQFAKLESSIDSRKKGQSSGPKEYILNRKDGSQVFVESRSFPVKSGDQNLTLTMVIDVTDRKRAHELLLQEQRELRNFSRRILSIREEEKRMLSANIHGEVGHIRFFCSRLSEPAEQDAKPGCVQNTGRPHPAGKRNPPAHRRGADRERDSLEAKFVFKHCPRPQEKHHAQARRPQAGQPCPLRR
jgi:PAS domain S-box-containing protein